MTKADRIKLARILGMLGSDHAGERAAAARATHRMVKAPGLTWWELMSPSLPRDPTSPVRVVVVEPFHGAVSAAESRMRQLRHENAALEREVKRLKRLLDARNAPLRRAGSRPAP